MKMVEINTCNANFFMESKDVVKMYDAGDTVYVIPETNVYENNNNEYVKVSIDDDDIEEYDDIVMNIDGNRYIHFSHVEKMAEFVDGIEEYATLYENNDNNQYLFIVGSYSFGIMTWEEFLSDFDEVFACDDKNGYTQYEYETIRTIVCEFDAQKIDYDLPDEEFEYKTYGVCTTWIEVYDVEGVRTVYVVTNSNFQESKTYYYELCQLEDYSYKKAEDFYYGIA